MNKKNKYLSTFLITFLLIFGIFAQTVLQASIAPIANDSTNLDNSDEDDIFETPKKSDVSGTYDWDDGTDNMMDIDALGSTTTTTLHNESGDDFKIDSEMTDGYSKTLINDTIQILADINERTFVNDTDGLFNVTLDNSFNAHAVESIQAIDNIHGGLSDIYAEANADMAAGYPLHGVPVGTLENFTLKDNGDDSFLLEYDWNEINDVRTLNFTGDLGFDWRIIQKGAPGNVKWIVVWLDVIWSDAVNISWNAVRSEYELYTWNDVILGWDYKFDVGDGYHGGSTIGMIWIDNAIGNDRGVKLSDNLGKWTVTIVCFSAIASAICFDVYVVNNLYLFSVHWGFSMVEIVVTWGMWIYTFYLFVPYGLLFVIIYPDYDFKLEYYYTYIVMVWLWIVIEIWWIDIYIFWKIEFIWVWWVILIDFWYSISSLLFVDYLVQITYMVNWVYIFHVPTQDLPNRLLIDIVESIYTDEWFNIKIKTTDLFGNIVDADTISGTWDDDDLTAENITDNGDGTFDINVTSKFIAAITPGLWLNLTAEKMGYANGTLNTQIAVEAGSISVIGFNKLGIDILKQSYSEDWFNITFFVFNASDNQGVAGLNFGTLLWNGTDVSDDIFEVIGEPGNYSISLEPITVDPTENPIKLSGSIDAGIFEQKDFVFYIGVDPEVIDKDKGVVIYPGIPAGDDDDGEGKEEVDIVIPIIIGVGIISAIAVAGIVIFLMRKRKR